jgi:hypothetical protein
MEVVGRFTTSKRRTPPPGVVPSVGALHLDHIGTKISEQHRTQRSGQDSGEVDHFETIEGGFCHFTHVLGLITVSSLADLDW